MFKFKLVKEKGAALFLTLNSGNGHVKLAYYSGNVYDIDSGLYEQNKTTFTRLVSNGDISIIKDEFVEDKPKAVEKQKPVEETSVVVEEKTEVVKKRKSKKKDEGTIKTEIVEA